MNRFFERNNKTVLLVIIAVLTLGLLWYVLSTNKKLSHLLPGSPTPTPVKQYKTLDKKLNTVLNSEKPVEAAKKDNIATQGNSIKAVITLKDESFVLLPIYGTQVLRYGKTIQAIIKSDKLEELAKNPKIESIQSVADSNLPPGVNIEKFKKK